VAALALLTGLAGAIYPMVYAVRVRSVEALRFDEQHTKYIGFKCPVLLAEDVWKDYDNGRSRADGCQLCCDKSETVALCGPSGCGKSTLLHLLGGLDEPDRGVIRVNGTMIDSEDARLPLLRHTIGFVFQLHNLIPDLTLEENCLLPAFAAGLDKQPRANACASCRAYGATHRLGHRIQNSLEESASAPLSVRSHEPPWNSFG